MARMGRQGARKQIGFWKRETGSLIPAFEGDGPPTIRTPAGHLVPSDAYELVPLSTSADSLNASIDSRGVPANGAQHKRR
jgi:hypothetical protein